MVSGIALGKNEITLMRSSFFTKGIIGKDYEKADRVSGGIGGLADHAHAAAKEI